jgi:zinc transport system ATP-binding protein
MSLATPLPPVPQSRAPLVSGSGICVRFGAQNVLDHVDIEVGPGEIVTLVGLNGSGKSTLARALLGLVPLAAGQVALRPGLRIGYVPQLAARDPALPLSVARFVALAGRVARPVLLAALEELGIGDLADAQISTLSGGEMRRALMARALIHAPDLLVLDEPMSGVDVAGQVELYRIIGEVRRKRGCGILLISHDLHLVMAETDRVICLNHHVCCAGTPHSVLGDPSFAALFGQDVANALAIYRHRHDHVHDPHGHVHGLPHE